VVPGGVRDAHVDLERLLCVAAAAAVLLVLAFCWVLFCMLSDSFLCIQYIQNLGVRVVLID